MKKGGPKIFFHCHRFTLGFLVGLSLLSFEVSATPKALTLFLDQVHMDHKRSKQLCYAYEEESPGLPCNPAFLGLRRKPQFWISSFGNNNLKYFQNVANIVETPVKADLLLDLIKKNSNEHFAASLSIGYLRDNWGFNIIPSKLILFTNIRNPSLPRITLLASRESEFQFQMGSFMDSEWSWGLQARYVQRDFSYNDGYFSDHFVDGSKDIYSTHRQQMYFLEPSILFAPGDLAGSPTFSATIDNLGTESDKHEPFDTRPNLRIGSSLTAQLEPDQQLQFGVTTHWLNDPDNSKFYSSIGINYSYSPFQIFANLGEIEQQVGLALNHQHLSTSLTYSRQDWANNQISDYYTLWRWELGWKF